jgi:hypothetical protein
MSANLTYSIVERLLTGTANGRGIHLSAVSGGGGGSTRHGENSDTNNPESTGVKTQGGRTHRHGGPIPTGRYRILPPSRHPHLGLSCRLDPYDAEQTRHMAGRDGFYIHGRGPHGSDGCIVPMEQFQALMTALERDRGGTLSVLEAIDGGGRAGASGS